MDDHDGRKPVGTFFGLHALAFVVQLRRNQETVKPRCTAREPYKWSHDLFINVLGIGYPLFSKLKSQSLITLKYKRKT